MSSIPSCGATSSSSACSARSRSTAATCVIEIILTVPGCPLKQNLEGQVRHHVGDGAGRRHASTCASRTWTRRSARRCETQLTGGEKPATKGLSVDDRTRVIAVASGKGGVGKSSLSVNLALALPRPRPRGRHRRRRHLRLVDPRHARHPAAPDQPRRDDHPAGRPRPARDVDRVLPRAGGRDHLARPDAAPRARAVPLGRALGPARLPRRRHAARHGRRRRSRSAS